MARSANDRFTVHAYDAYSGWDVALEGATRQEAWEAAKAMAASGTPCQIEGAEAIVYSAGDTGAADHSAWLGRCPR